MYQDPKNGYEEGQPLDKDGVNRLTNLCVDKIIDDRGPLMETVRMQVNLSIRVTKEFRSILLISLKYKLDILNT